MVATPQEQHAQMGLFTGFAVQIEIFEGPLDLLLHLVRRQELDIAEVRISDITDEYLRYLETMAAVSIEPAGEFIVVAANLLWLKSKALLPRQEDELEDELIEEEFMESEEAMRRRLEEYRAYREAAGLLAESRDMRRRIFLRSLSDDDEIRSGFVPLEDVSVFDMVAAIQEMLDRTKDAPPGIIRPAEITIADCIEAILLRLQSAPEHRCDFVDLIEIPTTRVLIVLVFLATLELVRRRRVRVMQGAEARQIVVALV